MFIPLSGAVFHGPAQESICGHSDTQTQIFHFTLNNPILKSKAVKYYHLLELVAGTLLFDQNFRLIARRR